MQDGIKAILVEVNKRVPAALVLVKPDGSEVAAPDVPESVDGKAANVGEYADACRLVFVAVPGALHFLTEDCALNGLFKRFIERRGVFLLHIAAQAAFALHVPILLPSVQPDRFLLFQVPEVFGQAFGFDVDVELVAFVIPPREEMQAPVLVGQRQTGFLAPLRVHAVFVEVAGTAHRG